ncbi:TPA: competence type IV pilus minor pilin ComGF [Streptococcus agalactiae]
MKIIRKFCTYQKLRVKAFTLLECLVALVTITGALLVYQGLTKLLAQQIVVMSSSSQSEWVLLTQQLNAEFEGAHLEYLRQNKLYLRKQDKIVTFGKSNKDDFRKTGYDGRGYQPMVYGLDNCQMSQTKSMVKFVFYFKDGLKRTFYYDFKEET